jgi:hypothetical protein
MAMLVRPLLLLMPWIQQGVVATCKHGSEQNQGQLLSLEILLPIHAPAHQDRKFPLDFSHCLFPNRIQGAAFNLQLLLMHVSMNNLIEALASDGRKLKLEHFSFGNKISWEKGVPI